MFTGSSSILKEKSSEIAAPALAASSTASITMGYCLWELKRIKNVEGDCQRLTKAQGKIRPSKALKVKSRRKHLMTDYSHVLPQLHCPWDEEAKQKRNEISPGKFYHGHHTTDVTERLNLKPPSHAAHPSLTDAPIEYHGRQAQDVTEMYTFASRGKRPPSIDHYYGREATDISESLRLIPPATKESDGTSEFFGRPRSDVTDYNLFPLRTIDTNSRSEAARPLGRCPPGPMCDYIPLVRDKDGRLIRPQPGKPPSPLCESGTHELPVSTTLVRKHQPDREQQFVPGAGGILAQIVPGFSRSEAKKPVGRGIPGVMADYVPLLRDENGRIMTPPRYQEQHSPRSRSVNSSEEAGNRYQKKYPLGKVPVGVMRDFTPNPPRGQHKHTTNGYWAFPSEYPPSPPCLSTKEAERQQQRSPGPMSAGEAAFNPADTLKCVKKKLKKQQQLSPGPMSPGEAALNPADTLKSVKKMLKRDPRRNAVCEMHEPGCPVAAEQGHEGSGISHPAISNYVKWPKEGDLERGPCEKHGGRSGIFSVKGSPCSATGSTSGTTTVSEKALGSCSASVRSPRSYSHGSSLANQSPLRPDTACPRVACEWIRVANKGRGAPSFGYADSISRLDPRYRTKASKGGSSRKSKSNCTSFVTEETSPQHFRVPYFGLAQTYVTNPAVSPTRRRRARSVPSRRADDAWFGRCKTFVTDPAVSPNLTPPCFASLRSLAR